MAASPYQQQARFRKLLYLGLIVALFTITLIWRNIDANVLGMPVRGINAQADSLGLRAESRGDADLTSSVLQLGLLGSRGVVTCFLWSTAIEKQKKNQWNELETLVRSLTKLQPHFITPWLFQSWNLAYNVSVESDRVRDKYFYVTRGVELLAQGERRNRYHPDLRWSIGFYLQHKIMQSDETNYKRSLFQLSMIPPNERDPARFWTKGEDDPQIDYAEFEKFLEEHPQLARRLREGMRKTNVREQKQLFVTEKPEDVIRFLEDNYDVPSMYRLRALPADVPAHARRWVKQEDELLPPDERFPVLPPRRDAASLFDSKAFSQESTLTDAVDGHAIAQAWYGYAQEALPLPSNLPGSSQPIVDRTRTRRPRNMTTLIFRSYPAQGRRYMAERLQSEGWFDEEPWDVSDWYENIPDRNLVGKTVKVGGGSRTSSLEAWKDAKDAWRSHGERNHILFTNVAAEQDKREGAERYARRGGTSPTGAPTPQDEERMSPAERSDYRDAQFMFEYNFYRNVSNFHHHYHRALVEAKLETVTCRKYFDRADRLNLVASEPLAALRGYLTPLDLPAWDGHRVTRPYGEPIPKGEGPTRPPNPLEAFRDLVLLKNKDYRRDNHNQEAVAEIQARFLHLYDRLAGVDQKNRIEKMASVLPLVPKLSKEAFALPIVRGPFDVLDDEGEPLVSDHAADTATDRMMLPYRRLPRQGSPPPGGMPPGAKPAGTPSP